MKKTTTGKPTKAKTVEKQTKTQKGKLCKQQKPKIGNDAEQAKSVNNETAKAAEIGVTAIHLRNRQMI